MKPETPKRNQRKVRGAYFISVVSITMVLLVFGYTVLLLVNGRKLSNYIKENIGFTVYLTENASNAETKRLEKFLNAQAYSRSIRYISKDEATSIMREELGNDFEMLQIENIFPASIDVSLKSAYAKPDSIAKIRKSLAEFSVISDFFYQKSMAELINRNIRKMSLFGFGFTALLLIITVSLINNTVRLSIYSKRFLMQTAKLLGAQESFIRRPFVYNAVVSGLLAGSLASLVIVMSVMVLRNNFSDLMVVEGEYISAAAILIFGMLIAGISAYMAATKYIRSRTDELFFEN
jgi:cell division transport system permease protein